MGLKSLCRNTCMHLICLYIFIQMLRKLLHVILFPMLCMDSWILEGFQMKIWFPNFNTARFIGPLARLQTFMYHVREVVLVQGSKLLSEVKPPDCIWYRYSHKDFNVFCTASLLFVHSINGRFWILVCLLFFLFYFLCLVCFCLQFSRFYFQY